MELSSLPTQHPTSIHDFLFGPKWSDCDVPRPPMSLLRSQIYKIAKIAIPAGSPAPAGLLFFADSWSSFSNNTSSTFLDVEIRNSPSLCCPPILRPSPGQREWLTTNQQSPTHTSAAGLGRLKRDANRGLLMYISHMERFVEN